MKRFFRALLLFVAAGAPLWYALIKQNNPDFPTSEVDFVELLSYLVTAAITWLGLKRSTNKYVVQLREKLGVRDEN